MSAVSTRKFPAARLSPAALLLVFACSAAAGAEDHALRLMTYNIRYANAADGPDAWPHRRDVVAQTMLSADVVGLQEVTAEQLQDVKQRTAGFTWYGVGRDDGRSGGEHSPVGFRSERFELLESGTFWLSATPAQAGSRGWDAALPRIASWVRLRDRLGEAGLLVVNTHFDHRGAQARVQSARLIQDQVQSLAKTDRVVVMGDLNAGPDSEPLQALLTAEAEVVLQDSRELSASPPAGPSGTWNGFRAIDENVRIDFILLGGSWEVLSHSTLNPQTADGRFASDHLPVQTVVQ